jgi:glutamate racemase
LPENIQLVEQGTIVADKLKDYLNRHPEMEERCSTEASMVYYTTEQAANFEEKATIFMKEPIKATTIHF